MNIQDLPQLQYFYELYTVQLDSCKNDLIVASLMLRNILSEEASDAMREALETPIRMKIDLLRSRIEFLSAAKIMLLDKINSERAFSCKKFDKIDLNINLFNN